MTPLTLSRRLTASLELTETSKILEPSFGEGSFLMAAIEELLKVGTGTRAEKLQRIFTKQLYGVELDEELYKKGIAVLEEKHGPLPAGHHLKQNDFFLEPYVKNYFDFIIGNPPFGGTFDSEIEDKLDRQYGKWGPYKLKKETYSFFIARSLDLLKYGGTLRFISSDTFLTISTMKGLRHRLMDQCKNEIEPLDNFSDETSYPMVVLTAVRAEPSGYITVDGMEVSFTDIELTDNFSWSINQELVKYFHGDKLSKYIVCTGGMTVGKNEYFIRELQPDGTFYEPYTFSSYQKPITLSEELEKARLGKMSLAKRTLISQQEAAGETYRALKVTPRAKPAKLTYPHKDYLPYNKATKGIIYTEPRYVIYWKDKGDAVLTYKKTGNWYLRGVGGQPYFLREGLTWQLISSRINMRYLPAGYILDSGAPCAFLREGVDHDELWFILGWTLTDLATHILKTAINHTKNIQGKDIERLPYPWWVGPSEKKQAVKIVKMLVSAAQGGQEIDRTHPELLKLHRLFEMKQESTYRHT